MKLEIKHLAGYLPYGLKGNYLLSNVVNTSKDELRDKLLTIDNVKFFLDYATPILRPLSDLTKEEWNSVFVDSDIDNILSIYQSDKHLGCVEYYLVNILLSHHFDIYGLIENGLAIDINTLEK